MRTFDFDQFEIKFEDMVFYKIFTNKDYRQTAMSILEQEYFDPPVGEYPYNIIFKHFKLLYDKPYDKITPIETFNSIIENEKFLDDDDVKTIKSVFKRIGAYYSDEKFGPINDVDTQYILDETELFCQEVAVEIALMKSIEIVQEKPENKNEINGLLETALSVGLSKDIGLDYSENLVERFDFYMEEEDKIPFSIKMLNNITANGFPRGSLNCFMAGTGIGKTLLMTSLSIDYIKKGYNVLYVTLEISEHRISMRGDANLLDIPMGDFTRKVDGENVVSSEELAKKFRALENKYNMGTLKIKQFPTGGASVLQIKSLLKELKSKDGFEPDIICVDYINLMNSSRISSKNANSYSIVKAIAEELRGLAVETNTAVITATQVNRDGISGDEVGLDKVSESAGLPHTTDLFCGVYQTEQQRENGILIIKPLKNRYSGFVNTKHALGVSYEHMRIYQLEDDIAEEFEEEDDSQTPETTTGTAFSRRRGR